jgi:CheY-like chemotaxis protein
MAEKMLVIDDEVIVLDSCRKVFSSDGYDVTVTTSPREGLELAKGSRFDVILCDWMMPEFSGMDVLEELERISPESTVVMISGYPNVGRATEALKRGAMDYMAKPFTPEEILETVRRATQRKVTEEKKTINRFEKIAKSWQFPIPAMEDKTPKTIAETVATTVGVGKVTSPWFSVLVLGILAGAYIGFGGLLATSVSFDLASKAGIGIQKLVAGSAFSLGLMLVVIAGAELFTGNNLMISSVLSREIGVRSCCSAGGWFSLPTLSARFCWRCFFTSRGSGKPGTGN